MLLRNVSLSTYKRVTILDVCLLKTSQKKCNKKTKQINFKHVWVITEKCTRKTKCQTCILSSLALT